MLAFPLLMALASPSHASDPADFVGTWDVKMKADFSTCDIVSEGDINAEQWMISFKSGALAVSVVNTDKTYRGFFTSSRGYNIRFEGTADNHQATAEVSGDGTKLTGRRVVANNGPCAIIYNLEMTKK